MSLMTKNNSFDMTSPFAGGGGGGVRCISNWVKIGYTGVYDGGMLGGVHDGILWWGGVYGVGIGCMAGVGDGGILGWRVRCTVEVGWSVRWWNCGVGRWKCVVVVGVYSGGGVGFTMVELSDGWGA